jgi:hypothetical protein
LTILDEVVVPVLRGEQCAVGTMCPESTRGDQWYEAKELATRFTLNNVGDCVFGVKAKCFEEENSEFRQLAREFLTPGSWSILAIFVATIFPVVMKIFPIR